MAETRRQVVVSRRGGPEVLEVRQAPIPTVGRGQIRIRVATAGVIFADILMRDGLYPDIPPFPFVPGVDAAFDPVAGRLASLAVGAAARRQGAAEVTGKIVLHTSQ